MLRKDLEKLIRLVEPQLIGILISNGYVSSKKKKFSDITFTQKGKSAIGMGDMLITDEWLQEWRSLWPTGKKGTPRAVRDKLNRFMMENDCSLEQVTKCAEYWLAEHQSPYCGHAGNFFYKLEQGNTEISRCTEVLEIIKEIDKDSINVYDDNLIIDEEY